MMHYKKGKNVEEDLSKEQIPIEELPENFLWMQVKGGTAVTNVVDYAKKALEDGSYRSVVWSGSDGGVGKTVSCAEILKRNFALHQVTRICYRKVEEFWDPQQDGLEQIVAKRNIPCVHILLSLDEIDPKTPGYQHSKAQPGFWAGAGLSDATEGPRKPRPQGQRSKDGGVGDKRGNYFTGPQLKKKGNRHYGNGTNDGDTLTGNVREGQDGGSARGTGRRDGPADGAGGSRKRGKPRDDHGRKPSEGAAGEGSNGGRQGGGGRREGGKKNQEKEAGNNQSSAAGSGKVRDTSMKMDTGGE